MASNIGCYSMCSQIPLQAATESGIHYISVKWLDNEVRYNGFYAVSDPIDFIPSSNVLYNENVVYFVTVRSPSDGPEGVGVTYSFRVNSAIYL